MEVKGQHPNFSFLNNKLSLVFTILFQLQADLLEFGCDTVQSALLNITP